MRKTTLYALIAAVSLGATNAAQADIITLPDPTYPYSNGILSAATQQLAFDGATLDVLDLTASTVSAYLPGSIVSNRNSLGMLTSMSYMAGPSSVNIDTASHAITGFGSEGGFVWTAAQIQGISLGGTLGFSNLTVDLKAGIVKGDLVGSNGVGSLNNVAIWTVGNISFAANLVGHNTCIPGQPCDFFGAEDLDLFELTLHASNLTMTTQARNAMRVAFGAPSNDLSQKVWAMPGNFSGLTLKADYAAPVGYNISVVPEPSTFALLGVGLLAIGGSLRQRRMPC